MEQIDALLSRRAATPPVDGVRCVAADLGERMAGSCKFFDAKKGYGFASPEKPRAARAEALVRGATMRWARWHSSQRAGG